MKSDTQSLFGRSAANCLFTLSSGHGIALSLIVVFIRLPRTTPCRPMAFMSRATVHRATANPAHRLDPKLVHMDFHEANHFLNGRSSSAAAK